MTSTRAARPVSISACVILALMLAGCQTMLIPSVGTDRSAAIGKAPFCSVAEPIAYSRKDTVETQKQAREHNAVGASLCGWGAK